ncbi:MAG: VCBS repeat-containing protein [Planctomycetota bacterium]
MLAPRSQALALTLSSFALANTAQAQFGDSVTLPNGAGDGENVDVADIDLDGDFDIAGARGGDFGPALNRLWINLGGLQGGDVGEFNDESAIRLPQFATPSRDVEFADIDADGDVDLYVTGHSTTVNAGGRWWVNGGGAQGATLGFYADETEARWVGLGGAGSSVSPSLVGDGTFIDWTGDADFADLDNDGDLDLVHSSYGSAYGGNTPTRLFLNDGDGRFEEFNPSGFQLVTDKIQNGDPALWAEGVQMVNTENVTGQEADIANSTVDLEVGDLDGDFDLDLLIGSRETLPRVFANRSVENGGALGFRDVTQAALPADAIVSTGKYEQELGDFDGDDDLDIYGLNWNGFSDATFRNDGQGTFTTLQAAIPGSLADEEEGDFIDYDNDGDLDVVVANFSGQNNLYANDGTGLLTEVAEVAAGSANSDRDVEAVDLDHDGAPDVIFAGRNGTNDRIAFNTTGTADTFGPRIPLVENLGDRVAAADRFPVRAHVYDNAAYYVTWYNRTRIAIEVDGFNLGSTPAMSSMGQVFRAELPANLVGDVTYRFRSFDASDNEGVSADESYSASTPLAFDASFGLATAGQGGLPSARSLSVPFAGTDYYVGVDGMWPGAPLFGLVATQALPTGLVLPGIGAEIWIGGTQLADLALTAEADGTRVFPFTIPESVASGITVHLQVFGLDGLGGSLLSATQGLSFTTQ